MQAVKRIEERMMSIVSRTPIRVPSNTVSKVREYIGEIGVKTLLKVQSEDVLWVPSGRTPVKARFDNQSVRRFLTGIDDKLRDMDVGIVELTWNPWFETNRGHYIKDKFIDTMKGVTGKSIELRWKFLSMKSMSVCMWKEGIPIDGMRRKKVADEDYRGIVETGV